jgi:hypothetical protein
MQRLTATLEQQFVERAQREQTIRDNVRGLDHGTPPDTSHHRGAASKA